MSQEIAARYAAYSTEELFELARAGESHLRPEARQSLKSELRKRGLEMTPEDESLAAGPTNASLTTDSELPRSEPARVSEPAPGFDGWLALFVDSYHRVGSILELCTPSSRDVWHAVAGRIVGAS